MIGHGSGAVRPVGDSQYQDQLKGMTLSPAAPAPVTPSPKPLPVILEDLSIMQAQGHIAVSGIEKALDRLGAPHLPQDPTRIPETTAGEGSHVWHLENLSNETMTLAVRVQYVLARLKALVPE